VARLLSQAKRPYHAATGTESLRLLPAAKPTSLYKGGFGWLTNVGGKTLPYGVGNGRLQGPLAKGAGFRDCVNKRGRLGDSCCGWRNFIARRREQNPSGFCLRQNPPPFTREAWAVSQRRWRDFTVWRWERNPSGFCLRQNPPPFTREAWVAIQCRWRDFTVRQWER